MIDDEPIVEQRVVSPNATARAAGTAAIAYAHKPGKAHALAAHAPDAIIGAMAELITTAEQLSDL